MSTLQEMIDEFSVAPPAVAETPEQRTWRLISGRWLPFAPPRLPRTGLTLEWLWLHILDDEVAAPTATEIKAAAADEDRRYPECQAAHYRRGHSDWLAQEVARSDEYYSKRRWCEFEAALNGRCGLPQERLVWLQTREETIRPMIEEAKAGHFRRYSVGTFWLRPGADGEVSACKRARWPAARDRSKVPLAYCTQWTRPEDRASQLRDCDH